MSTAEFLEIREDNSELEENRRNIQIQKLSNKRLI